MNIPQIIPICIFDKYSTQHLSQVGWSSLTNSSPIKSDQFENILRIPHPYYSPYPLISEHTNDKSLLLKSTLAIAQDVLLSNKINNETPQKIIIRRKEIPQFLACRLYVSKLDKKIYLLWNKQLDLQQKGAFKKCTAAISINLNDSSAQLHAHVRGKKRGAHNFSANELTFMNRWSDSYGFIKIHDTFVTSSPRQDVSHTQLHIISDFYPYTLFDCSSIIQYPFEGIQQDSPISTTDEVLRVCADSLFTLLHIHSKKVAHRDIKPDNILIRATESFLSETENAPFYANTLAPHVQVALNDWGHARDYSRLTSLISPDHPISSFGAPEEFLNRDKYLASSCNFDVEAKKDVYSLGLSLLTIFFSISNESEELERAQKWILFSSFLAPDSTVDISELDECESIISFTFWATHYSSKMSELQLAWVREYLKEAYSRLQDHANFLSISPLVTPLQQKIVSVLAKMISINPEDRLSAQEAYNHLIPIIEEMLQGNERENIEYYNHPHTQSLFAPIVGTEEFEESSVVDSKDKEKGRNNSFEALLPSLPEILSAAAEKEIAIILPPIRQYD